MKEKYGIQKLKKVLINDKHFRPENLNNILKSEIFKCLSSFLEIIPEELNSKLQINEDGNFEFSLCVIAKRLKIFGMLPKEV